LTFTEKSCKFRLINHNLNQRRSIMATVTKSPILFAFLVLFASTFASAQQAAIGEKVLVKSFNPQGKNVVMLDLSSGKVEIKRSESGLIRVEMTIALANTNEATLQSLIVAGRYNLQADSNNNDALSISAPGLQHAVKLKGQDLKETIRYQVTIPKNLELKLSPNTTKTENKTAASL
jgi:hypothetical protein